MSTQGTQHSLAILDDYAGIAEKHFTALDNLHVATFLDTLSATTDLDKLIAHLKPYSIISTMRERTAFPSTLLSQLPNLRLLLTTGLRNASIDTAYCKAHSIPLAGTKGDTPVYFDASGKPLRSNGSAPEGTARTANLVPGGSTAQHTLSLLLALTSRIPHDDAALKADPGAWQSSLTIPLQNKTLGVVGLGKLGGAFARMCVLALGMKVVAWSSSLTQEKADEVAQGAGLGKGAIKVVEKKELFETADVVSVHYVLSERSRGLVGREELGAMKRSAMLVNTARGPIVDEEALVDVLRKGKIRGAALDVFWGAEPLEKDSVWRTEKWGTEGRREVVLSPHMGYVNEDTMECWYAEQAADVERWLKGDEIRCRIA